MMQKASPLSNSNQLAKVLAFEIEHLLSLPCHVYWKDLKGIYMGYNPYGMQRLGFTDQNDVVGHSDLDIFPYAIAIEFRNNDQDAMRQKKQIFIHEEGVLKDKVKIVFFTYKMPLFDVMESVIGILGLSFTGSAENRSSPAQLEQNFNYHPDQHKNRSLSKMEDACVRDLCTGLTTKQIARHLNLSPRTVETYIERAKIKFNCHNRTELMWKIVNEFN